jgi:hypothetical protein
VVATKDSEVKEVLLDEFLQEVLQEQMAGAVPSLAVRERILRRARARIVRRRHNLSLNWRVTVAPTRIDAVGLLIRSGVVLGLWVNALPS